MDLSGPSGGEDEPFHSSPVIVGEALSDQFSDGREVVGGAPLNVAWNLAGFGRMPTFVSAVGDDELGGRITAALRRWGIPTDSIVRLHDHPTGSVRVDLSHGEPRYEIVYPVAYDFLPPPAEIALPAGRRLVYFGSLAWRRPEALETLQAWVRHAGPDRFVDVNIRRPWFDTRVLELLVSGARFVKLNEDELTQLSQRPTGSPELIQEAVEGFRRRYGGEVFFITCGSQGAYAVAGGEAIFSPAPRPPQFRDTVGAGDAFAAAVIDGLLDGSDLTACIQRGVQFAARICGIHGATSEDRGLYEQESWT